MKGQLVSAVIFICLCSFVAAADRAESALPDAPGQALDADLKAMQGRWVREHTNDHGGVLRVEKLVQRNHAYVTTFDPQGNVIYASNAPFKLSREGTARAYTFSNLVVTAGADAGLNRKEPVTFFYRIWPDAMCEVWGLRETDRQPNVTLIFWKRDKQADQPAK